MLFAAQPPVDQFHQPAAGQAVEVLRAAAKLSESPAEAGAYAAATTGIVTTVTAAYQADTQEVVIGTALGDPTTDSPVIFLRVWQETIPAMPAAPSRSGTRACRSPSTPAAAPTTSATTGSSPYGPGCRRPSRRSIRSATWMRRSRRRAARLWACPLAVVAWSKGVPTVTDCRNHFGGLVTVDDDECCCVCVSVDKVGGKGLQALINRYAKRGPVTFCLQPGRYTLPKPLVITGGHRGLTIKACGPGVVIEAEYRGPRTSSSG